MCLCRVPIRLGTSNFHIIAQNAIAPVWLGHTCYCRSLRDALPEGRRIQWTLTGREVEWISRSSTGPADSINRKVIVDYASALRASYPGKAIKPKNLVASNEERLLRRFLGCRSMVHDLIVLRTVDDEIPGEAALGAGKGVIDQRIGAASIDHEIDYA